MADYLGRIVDRQAFDQKGLIYGMGHAVYSLSDPRAVVFKSFVHQLADAKEINEQRAAEDDAVLEDTAEEKAE